MSENLNVYYALELTAKYPSSIDKTRNLTQWENKRMVEELEALNYGSKLSQKNWNWLPENMIKCDKSESSCNLLINFYFNPLLAGISLKLRKIFPADIKFQKWVKYLQNENNE